MGILEDSARTAMNSEQFFREKNILFIGSESHDAPTITVLQGLRDLGFTIFTIKKWNINSWFCNVVLDNPGEKKFDFVLSNLHWGTRWSYYERFNLRNYFKVLIDGDDNRNLRTWRDKYDSYVTEYVMEPPEEVKDREVSDFRWLERLGSYSPDLVFTAQKQIGDQVTHYLPFGIQHEFGSLYEGRGTEQRSFDVSHIDGPGRKRWVTRRLLTVMKRLNVIQGTIFNAHAFGEKQIDPRVEKFYLKEKTENNIVHAYFRWTLDLAYYRILNNSKLLIYPGVDRFPFWDSKRPWEAYANGCLVMFSEPPISVSEYPPMALCEFANYSSFLELVDKCRFLYKHQAALNKYRLDAVTRAHVYFSPVPLARYFLHRVHQAMGRR